MAFHICGGPCKYWDFGEADLCFGTTTLYVGIVRVVRKKATRFGVQFGDYSCCCCSLCSFTPFVHISGCATTKQPENRTKKSEWREFETERQNYISRQPTHIYRYSSLFMPIKFIWMWLCATVCTIYSATSCTLANLYRIVDKNLSWAVLLIGKFCLTERREWEKTTHTWKVTKFRYLTWFSITSNATMWTDSMPNWLFLAIRVICVSHTHTSFRHR